MSSQFSLHNPNNKSVNSSGTYRFNPYIAAEVSVSKVAHTDTHTHAALVQP